MHVSVYSRPTDRVAVLSKMRLHEGMVQYALLGIAVANNRLNIREGITRYDSRTGVIQIQIYPPAHTSKKRVAL